MDNGKIIAEQTDFTHAVRGEQDGLLIVSAVSDQLNDVSGGDHVEPNCVPRRRYHLKQADPVLSSACERV